MRGMILTPLIVVVLSGTAYAGETGPESETEDASVEADAGVIDVGGVFGFTDDAGSSEAGDREISSTLEVGTGRDGVSKEYLGVRAETEFETSPIDGLALSVGLSSVDFDPHLPGSASQGGPKFGGLSVGATYGVIAADENTPIDFAVSGQAEWERYAEETGDPSDAASLSFGVAADTALIPDKLFAAANLALSSGKSLSDGGWQSESSLEASLALSYQLASGVFIGAETRLERDFDSATFGEEAGSAIHVGPTFYAALSESTYLKAAWSTQISGSSVDDTTANLNLTDFNRNEFIVGVGYSF